VAAMSMGAVIMRVEGTMLKMILRISSIAVSR
jgi:hypothetical protein